MDFDAKMDNRNMSSLPGRRSPPAIPSSLSGGIGLRHTDTSGVRSPLSRSGELSNVQKLTSTPNVVPVDSNNGSSFKIPARGGGRKKNTVRSSRAYGNEEAYSPRPVSALDVSVTGSIPLDLGMSGPQAPPGRPSSVLHQHEDDLPLHVPVTAASSVISNSKSNFDPYAPSQKVQDKVSANNVKPGLHSHTNTNSYASNNDVLPGGQNKETFPSFNSADESLQQTPSKQKYSIPQKVQKLEINPSKAQKSVIAKEEIVENMNDQRSTSNVVLNLSESSSTREQIRKNLLADVQGSDNDDDALMRELNSTINRNKQQFVGKSNKISFDTTQKKEIASNDNIPTHSVQEHAQKIVKNSNDNIDGVSVLSIAPSASATDFTELLRPSIKIKDQNISSLAPKTNKSQGAVHNRVELNAANGDYIPPENEADIPLTDRISAAIRMFNARGGVNRDMIMQGKNLSGLQSRRGLRQHLSSQSSLLLSNENGDVIRPFSSSNRSALPSSVLGANINPNASPSRWINSDADELLKEIAARKQKFLANQHAAHEASARADIADAKVEILSAVLERIQLTLSMARKKALIAQNKQINLQMQQFSQEQHRRTSSLNFQKSINEKQCISPKQSLNQSEKNQSPYHQSSTFSPPNASIQHQKQQNTSPERSYLANNPGINSSPYRVSQNAFLESASISVVGNMNKHGGSGGSKTMIISTDIKPAVALQNGNKSPDTIRKSNTCDNNINYNSPNAVNVNFSPQKMSPHAGLVNNVATMSPYPPSRGEMHLGALSSPNQAFKSVMVTSSSPHHVSACTTNLMARVVL